MQNKFFISFLSIFFLLVLSACSEPESASGDTSKVSATGTVYERDYSPELGPESAKVTIVEFFDPACGACRAFHPVVKEIMSRHPNDVRVVLRYAAFHKGTDTVVRMLEAARLQNKFEAVLEALLKDQQLWVVNHVADIEKAWNVAEAAGLDTGKAKEVMNSDAITQVLAQEKADIASLKVSKTPTFYVNEKPLPSFGAQQLYDLVVAEITATK